MVRKAKSYKAGFVVSRSNLMPSHTLKDVLELKERTGHSTVAITSDGSPKGKLLGIVTGRDYRISRDSLAKSVERFHDAVLVADLRQIRHHAVGSERSHLGP